MKLVLVVVFSSENLEVGREQELSSNRLNRYYLMVLLTCFRWGTPAFPCQVRHVGHSLARPSGLSQFIAIARISVCPMCRIPVWFWQVLRLAHWLLRGVRPSIIRFWKWDHKTSHRSAACTPCTRSRKHACSWASHWLPCNLCRILVAVSRRHQRSIDSPVILGITSIICTDSPLPWTLVSVNHSNLYFIFRY